MTGPVLSILMPCYNEAATVEQAVKRVLDVSFPCAIELVVVDDGSVDGTAAMLDGITDDRFRLLRHPSNRGKGAAVRTAAAAAQGDYVVVCDADLEYAPEELPALLQPVLEHHTDVVFGTRSFGSHTAYSFWYVMGNKAVTFVANLLYNSWISDLETGYKLLPRSLFQELGLRSEGFGFEAELTAKLLRRGIRPFEIPVHYQARSRDAGKKLTWRDGVAAIWILTRIRLGRAR